MASIQFPFDLHNIKSADEFRAKAGQAGYEIPVSDDLAALRKPFSVNGRKIETL